MTRNEMIVGALTIVTLFVALQFTIAHVMGLLTKPIGLVVLTSYITVFFVLFLFAVAGMTPGRSI